jgi:hypothetical protein
LPLTYFCWIFPLKEEKGLVKSVWDFSGVIDTAEIVSGVSMTMTSLKFEYNPSHMRNSFRPWISALGGIVWWKKPRVENLVQLFL